MARYFYFGVKNLLFVTSIFCGIAFGQSSAAQEMNPLAADPRAVRVGGSLFRAQCATCHGADAKGIEDIEAPDLTLMYLRDGVTDASVFQIIREGIPGSIMPPHTFSDAEVWTLVSYLRSAGIVGTSTTIEGNTERGLLLFNNNCAQCHRVGVRGGSLGPDLSSITNRRSQDALINSIRNPSATISRRYKPVTLIFQNDGIIHGTIKSEDAFSIQIMDSNQVLRGFRKSLLQEVIYGELSLMPSFPASVLSDGDINDVLNFLQSTRQ
ncbi:MAG: hypothetical protein CMQ41_05780 [Gammaproteobacteria bacterium]|nr:hypothetical protein [Gammaproteobacteria bacterium]